MRRRVLTEALSRSVGVLMIMIPLKALAAGPAVDHVLFRGIEDGNMALLRSVLRRGSPADVRRSDGTTPLMWASLHGSPEMVRVLLDRGADANATNDAGVTALLWGASDAAKVRLLLEHGADPNAASRLGNTPLMAASRSPTGSEAVALLIDRGSDVRDVNNVGRNVLWFAAAGGNVETVRRLLDRAAELDAVDQLASTSRGALSRAASHGFPAVVNQLLDAGIDPNRQRAGVRSNTLHDALLAGHTEIAETLVHHGAKLDRRLQPGRIPTTVLAAYNERDEDSIARLFGTQTKLDETSERGETALTWARIRGHQKLIDSLVELGVPEGASPERPDIPHRRLEGDRVDAKLLASAIQNSIELLQTSSDTFLDIRRNCVSCHQQNLPSVAVSWARDKEFEISQSSMQRIIDRQTNNWRSGVERAYQLAGPYPVPPRFLGWGMWSLSELGYPADDLTQAVSWLLAKIQQPDGRWTAGLLRPPMGGNDIMATALAMRSLQLYPLVGRPIENNSRIEAAARYLRDVEPRTFLDQLNRLMGLGWAGLHPSELSEEVASVFAAQRDDGGWAQLPNVESDAWATGQALVTLHAAGGVAVDDPRFQAGIRWLVQTQFEDGSWFVQARAFPFQPYFESKFPYGHNQWISAPATAWATMALTLAVDRTQVADWNAHRPESGSQAARPAQAADADADAHASPATLPEAVDRTVEFAEIKPLLARSCLGCHNDDEAEANFAMTSRERLVRGGDSELPAVIPGVSSESPMVRFAAGVEPEMKMPPAEARDEYPPLTADEVARLRAWIDQGAQWQD